MTPVHLNIFLVGSPQSIRNCKTPHFCNFDCLGCRALAHRRALRIFCACANSRRKRESILRVIPLRRNIAAPLTYHRPLEARHSSPYPGWCGSMGTVHICCYWRLCGSLRVKHDKRMPAYKMATPGTASVQLDFKNTPIIAKWRVTCIWCYGKPMSLVY